MPCMSCDYYYKDVNKRLGKKINDYREEILKLRDKVLSLQGQLEDAHRDKQRTAKAGQILAGDLRAKGIVVEQEHFAVQQENALLRDQLMQAMQSLSAPAPAPAYYPVEDMDAEEVPVPQIIVQHQAMLPQVGHTVPQPVAQPPPVPVVQPPFPVIHPPMPPPPAIQQNPPQPRFFRPPVPQPPAIQAQTTQFTSPAIPNQNIQPTRQLQPTQPPFQAPTTQQVIPAPSAIPTINTSSATLPSTTPINVGASTSAGAGPSQPAPPSPSSSTSSGLRFGPPRQRN